MKLTQLNRSRKLHENSYQTEEMGHTTKARKNNYQAEEMGHTTEARKNLHWLLIEARIVTKLRK